MADVKICGLSTPDMVDAAVEGGARYVGFIFFPKSPRHVSVEQAAQLAARARGRADVVAVTVDADDELLARIRDAVRPDWVQAHGRESPARLGQLRAYAGKGMIKALGVSRREDLAEAATFAGAADMLLFDAKPPPGGLPGGNALAFDWQILSNQKVNRPWLLSGGLNPDNVAEAITISGAGAVDVSSGIETSPGLKDRAKIDAFLAAARPL